MLLPAAWAVTVTVKMTMNRCPDRATGYDTDIVSRDGSMTSKKHVRSWVSVVKFKCAESWPCEGLGWGPPQIS